MSAVDRLQKFTKLLRRHRRKKVRQIRSAHRSQQLVGHAPQPRAERDTALSRFLPNWWGTIGANIASWIALGPSFLPRTWWMTAGSVSLSQLYGYGIGSGLRLVRVVLRIPIRRVFGLRDNPFIPPRLAQIWRWTSVIVMSAGTVVAFLRSIPRQREIAGLVDAPTPSTRTQLTGLVAGSGMALSVLTSINLFRLQSHSTRLLLRRFAPALAAPFSGTLVTAALTYWLNRSIVWERVTGAIERSAIKQNLAQPLGRKPPTQSERSGSAQSYEPFNTLGRHGKITVSDGPRAKDIAAFWGEPAQEPVRAYVGLHASVSIPEAAQRAVAELKRAGGFDRDVICVMVGTGTGWLNDWSMASLEYLTRGNCAIVSLQYTILTSALALLVDRNSPQLTGQSLYRAVMAEVEAMPQDKRPRVFMSGESLGAFGGLSEFADADDMYRRLDGAIWAGTPSFTPIWEQLTTSREPGSREIQPVIEGGDRFRFSNRSSDLLQPDNGAPYDQWRSEKRFIFMQHASDPVVWGQLSLIWREPDWMHERRGFDVTRHMHWWPWVTFWQIAADMPMSITTRGGHAHRYYEEYVAAWAQVLGIDNLDVEALQREIAPFIHPH